MGGYGSMKYYHQERMMRDAKITQRLDGDHQTERQIVVREHLGGQRCGVAAGQN